MKLSNIRYLKGEYNKSTTKRMNLGNFILFFRAMKNPRIKTAINRITIKIAKKTIN